MKLPKRIAALLTVTLVASSSGNLGYADTTNTVFEDKLVGAGRWETAIEVSKKGWTKSDKAIIVNDNAIADALAATPFAEAEDAPILLTGKDTLDERTKAELDRLGVEKVYLIGGEAVLSKNIETELKAKNIEIDRIQGETRELTALEIANRLDKIKDVSEIAVVNGYTGLADAVSIAAVAADKDMAIILSNPNEGTKASDEFIKNEEIKTSYVIGGPNAISKDVESKLPNVKRIEGIDRNETNAKVIETFYSEIELSNTYVAKDGMGKEDQLIDALSVGVLAAKNDSPVIIVGNKLNQMQKDVTNTKRFKTVTQVGGNGNETAFDELKTMQGVNTYEVTTVAELNDALDNANANDIINVRSLNDNTESNNTIEFKSNNAITVNLYDNSKPYVVDMKNGIFNDLTSTSNGGSNQNLTISVSGVSVVTDGDNVTVTATAKNYGSRSAKIELIQGTNVVTSENSVKIANGAISHTFKEVKNGDYTIKVTVGSVNAISQLFTLNPWDGITKTEVTPVDGVYEINTASQLAWIADFVNQGNTTISIKLINDIDLNNKEWTPIGTSSNHFRGSFDGGNHTIKNLSINKEDSSDLGLFGYTNSGTNIRNITLEDVNIVGKKRIGSLVGSIFDEQTSSNKDEIIENCHVKNVNINAKLKDAGGLVGYGYVDVKDCSVDKATVIADRVENDGDNVGGAIGYLASVRTVSNVKVNDVTLSGERKVGGIAGSANDSAIVFENCTVSGNTLIDVRESKASYAFAGGILGESVELNLTVKDCFVDKDTVKILGENSNSLGWFVGGAGDRNGSPVEVGEINFKDSKGIGCTFENNGFAWDGETLATVAPVERVYQVSTASQLAWIADFVNQGNTNISIKLMSDIDLNNIEWTPIGTETNKFYGSFDGNNKTIKNLSINKEDGNYIGLFGYGDRGIELKDINIENVNITGKKNVGSLIGYIFGTGTINNCNVKNAEITATLKDVGGIIGAGYVNISNCNIDNVTVKAIRSDEDGDNVGGVIGFLADAKHTVENIIANNVTLSGERKVGGIAGSSNGQGTVFKKCEVTGDSLISVKGSKHNEPYVGGILGKLVGDGITVSEDCSVGEDVKIESKNGRLLDSIVGEL